MVGRAFVQPGFIVHPAHADPLSYLFLFASCAAQDMDFGDRIKSENPTMTTQAIETRPMTAAGNMIGAMMLLGFVDIYVAVIAETISVWQFMACRGVLAMALVWGLARAGLGRLRPLRLWAVGVRSSLIAVGMAFYFGSLAFMPIAQSLAGLFTSPIFVMLISGLVLRHRIGPWRVVALLIGFAGILTVLGVQNGLAGWIMLMPVAGGFFYACGSVVTRVLCANEDTLSMLLGILLVQTVLGAGALVLIAAIGSEATAGAAGFLTRGWVWEMGPVAGLVVLQAVLSVMGVGLLIRAYQFGEASQVAVLEYTIMIFGPFFAWLLMGQAISVAQIYGIGLIALSGTIIALRSRD
jgi:drug/metabolite transporter (DMT)-like permease